MGFKIKGQEFQHAGLTLVIVANEATLEIETFSKVDWKDGAVKKPAKDHKGNIDGYTIGERETDGNISMRRSEWLKVKRFLKQQYPDKGVGQIELTAQVQYSNSMEDLTGADEIDFLINEEKFTSESNQETHMVDLPLFVSDVRPAEGRFIEYGD